MGTTLTPQRPCTRMRGRPRDHAIDLRIKLLALNLYMRSGWADFTMEEIAKRAGVSKATIYLRWKDKHALLADAFSSVYPERDEVDRLAGQHCLEAMLTCIAKDLSSEYALAIHWALRDPELPDDLLQLCRGLIIERRTAVVAAVQSARLRQGLATEQPDDIVADLVIGAVMSRAGIASVRGTCILPAEVAQLAEALMTLFAPRVPVE